jgi:hypothetical protein
MQAQKTKYESRNGKPNKIGSSRLAKSTPNETAKNGMPVNKMVAKLIRFAGGIIFSASHVFISVLQFPRAISGSSEALQEPIRARFKLGLKLPISRYGWKSKKLDQTIYIVRFHYPFCLLRS